MRASYLMSGVATGLRRNASMTVALVLSTAIALFFLGGALLINQEISKTQTAYKDKINVSIYLCTVDLEPDPGLDLQARDHRSPNGRRWRTSSGPTRRSSPTASTYIDQNEATSIAKQRLGAKVVDEAGPGAIPSSFTIRLKNLKTDYVPVATATPRSPASNRCRTRTSA